MTTQPSDWAVARAFRAFANNYMVRHSRASAFVEGIEKRARELDASGGGMAPEGYQCLTEHMPFWGECTHELYEHIRATGYYGKPGQSVKAQARALYAHPPGAAEAGDDTRRLDWIERTYSGMTNRERYLPVVMIWGKGANGRTLREAIDKYMKREGVAALAVGGEDHG